MNNIAIIPARGGSKRIPKKNIRDFLGKPVIAYAIENAQKSGLFSEVMVSTDTEEIADIASDFGAKIPFLRSTDNSNDFATVENVIDEVLKKYLEIDLHFDSFCCIMPTSPLLSPNILKDSYSKFVGSNYDSLFPVILFSYPIQRALKISGKNIVMNNPEFIHTRSQDLEPMYHDAGLFYWMRVNSFESSKEIFCSNAGMIELSELEVQDIDTYSDWDIAELKYKILNNIL